MCIDAVQGTVVPARKAEPSVSVLVLKSRALESLQAFRMMGVAKKFVVAREKGDRVSYALVCALQWVCAGAQKCAHGRCMRELQLEQTII